MTQEIREWAMKLAECAGQDQQRAEEFVAGLEKYRDVQEEFCYYYERQNFCAKTGWRATLLWIFWCGRWIILRLFWTGRMR